MVTDTCIRVYIYMCVYVAYCLSQYGYGLYMYTHICLLLNSARPGDRGENGKLSARNAEEQIGDFRARCARAIEERMEI